jgi:hypothetical protein
MALVSKNTVITAGVAAAMIVLVKKFVPSVAAKVGL